MRKNHKNIRDLLPEYLQKRLADEDSGSIARHLESCEECRVELNLIKTVADLEVPEPGDRFWQSLPLVINNAARQRSSSRRTLRAFLWRPASILAAMGILLILALSVYLTPEGTMVDPFFIDPLAANIPDYSILQEEDIIIPINLESYDESLSQTGGALDYSYSMDIASLGSEELGSLIKTLMQEQQNGG